MLKLLKIEFIFKYFEYFKYPDPRRRRVIAFTSRGVPNSPKDPGDAIRSIQKIQLLSQNRGNSFRLVATSRKSDSLLAHACIPEIVLENQWKLNQGEHVNLKGNTQLE